MSSDNANSDESNQASAAPAPLTPVKTTNDASDDPVAAALAAQNITPDAAAAPAVSDEDDVIDLAWIERSKTIILATRDNPHEQAKQLAALKAEYLQKRYHKKLETAA